MAKIIHRPKPEVVAAPDYNKVLQNLKPAQHASMQARAEQEQARSRFEQSLQKAAGKGEQNSPSRSAGANTETRRDVARGVADRTAEKQSASAARRGSGNLEDSNPQPVVPARAGRQEKASVVKTRAERNCDTARGSAEEIRETQIRNKQNSALGTSMHNGLNKPVSSEEEDGVAEAALETLACPSPLGIQEQPPAMAALGPMARAGNTSDFETIESMLNHLSLMTARYGPRDWKFDIQNENSALVSVSMAPAANGGWNVAVAARPEDQAGAQLYLAELQEMLEGVQLVSLNVKDPAQDRTEHERDN